MCQVVEAMNKYGLCKVTGLVPTAVLERHLESGECWSSSGGEDGCLFLERNIIHSFDSFGHTSQQPPLSSAVQW